MDNQFREEEFHTAKAEVLGRERERDSIGKLQEKTVHAVLKNYIDPDPEHQEIPCCGFVADILNERGVFEIQTAGFDKLVRKLDAYLPELDVTVVHPLCGIRYLNQIDSETGEILARRKSPKKETVYDAFREMYRLRGYLGRERLHFRFCILEVEEYRFLNEKRSTAKRRRYHRFDRIPVTVIDDISIDTREDFAKLVPEGLPEEFTSSEFAKAAGIRRETAGLVLLMLTDLGTVVRTGKRGNSYLYTRES